MRTIWKFEKPLNDDLTIVLPVDSSPIVRHVDIKGNTITTWVEVNSEATSGDLRTVRLLVRGTGHPIPTSLNLLYLRSVQDDPFVWHVFEVLS